MLERFLIIFFSLSGLTLSGAEGTQSWPLLVAEQGAPGFVQMEGIKTGVLFTNSLIADRHLTNQILLNGSGVAAGDVNGDGKADLFFCGLDQDNRLFLNQGNWQFTDASQGASFRLPGMDSTGAALADLDGDADLDLVINTVGDGTFVFGNDGKGNFQPMGQPFNVNRGGMSLALADVDGDGDLDLYVANYRTTTIRDQPDTQFTMRMVNGQPQVAAVNGVPVSHPDVANRFDFKVRMGNGGGSVSHEEKGEADALYLNDGKGRFAAVRFTDGMFLDEMGSPLAVPPFDWGLSVMMRDLNGDGAPDIYVCNDFESPDRIWMNDGLGRFQLISPLAIRHTSLSSMGVDVADINRDGHDDIFVVDMLSRDHERRFTQHSLSKPISIVPGVFMDRPQYPRNTLFLNRGDGSYSEIAQLSGLDASEWSWTPLFLDVDLDGYEDLLISNGFERDGMNADVLQKLGQLKKQLKNRGVHQLRMRRLYPRLNTANLAFRNRGDLRFEDRSDSWGFNAKSVTHGMALADLDNDGDLDVVMNNQGDEATVYQNRGAAPRIAVKLKGSGANTHGIGARIELIGGGLVQRQEVIAGGRYLSSDQPIRTFAAKGSSELKLKVTWRTGRTTEVRNVVANHLYEIVESESQREVKPVVPAVVALMKDESGLIGHRHRSQPGDDFGKQPMLSRRLSQLGPAVAWFDFDADGWDDLMIGAGGGGTMSLFRGDSKGGFERTAFGARRAIPFNRAGLVGHRLTDGSTRALVGLEWGWGIGGVQSYQIEGGDPAQVVPRAGGNVGPLALADVDGDGNLDLFVGRRSPLDSYPSPAKSGLFRGVGGQFLLDETNSVSLSVAGLVSGAVFSDLDVDGDPDLILAVDWGPIMVFRNDDGHLVDATAELGLSKHQGWWNGVTTGDVDGDGRPDIVASNWGSNTRYESHRPQRVYYGDVDGNGTFEVVEAYLGTSGDGQDWLPFQAFTVAAKALPSLRAKFATFNQYSKSSIREIYGAPLSAHLDVNWLETTVFMNRGERFEAKPLPVEAQFSPAFGVVVSDFNGDGHQDLFLAQNFFAVAPEYSRLDGGQGLMLAGEGTGSFRAMRAAESGIEIHGEQRAAATSDFDRDGRLDLVVSQNVGDTRLFRNSGGRPGLRVRFEGDGNNPLAVGAMVRPVSGDDLGAAQEVQAGSGYWSQSSATLVLHAPRRIDEIEVRWPGGNVQRVPVPSGAKEITVKAE